MAKTNARSENGDLLRVGTIATVAARSLEVAVRRSLGLNIRPYKALLEVTSSCNSRCTTCDIWKNPASVKKSDIGLSEIDALFKSFGKDLVWLALSGGEVTLCDHFPKIIESSRKHCPNLKLMTFTTNGLLPEKALEYARALAANGFDSFITVSLDGDKNVHDEIRGVQGNYELAQKTLQLLRSAGFNAHFGITLGDKNREYIRSRFDWVKQDVKAVTYVASGGMYRRENLADDNGILESINIILKSYRISGPGELVEWIYLRLARRFFSDGRQRLPLACDVLRTSVHIKPNGEVLPCMFLPPIGNLKEKSISKILKSSDAQRAVVRIDSGNCPRCWMNCYAPHSILSRPLTAALRAMSALS